MTFIAQSSSNSVSTTVIETTNQELAVNSFNINNLAEESFIANLPSSAVDGDIVEVLMTRATTPTIQENVNFFFEGGTASGSGDLNGSWTAAGVPAGGTWIGPGSSQWWLYDASASYKNKLTAMNLGSWGDGGGNGLKAFTLYGSNDNSNWTSIYSGTHENNTSVESYSFANNTYYRYYKLTDFQSWRGDGIVALNMTANSSREGDAAITLSVKPPVDVRINQQGVGVSRLMASVGDYEKYRFDGSQWWIIDSYGTPNVGS